MTIHQSLQAAEEFTANCRLENSAALASVLEVLSGTFFRCEVRAPWRMAFTSQGVTELTGYPPEYFRDRAWAELMFSEDLDKAERAVAAALAGRTIYSVDYRIVNRSGETVWVRDRGKAVYDAAGEPLFLEGIITDVTLERRLEAEASEASAMVSASRAHLTSVLESTSDCIITFDQDWRFTYVNGRAASELGNATELLGRHVLDAFPALVETPFWGTYQQVMADRQPRSVEGFMPTLGSWYQVYAAPSDGGITIFFSNINARKAAEKALRDSEQRLQRTLDHIPQMVWSTRPDGYHDYYSRLWYEFTGVDPGSTDGDEWNNMFHPEDRAGAWKAWRHSLDTGAPYEIEYRLRHSSGQYRWVLGRAWCERDERGEIVRWYGTCTDVHDRVQAERALQESEARTDKILNSVPQVIWSAALDGRLTFVSQQWSILYGGDSRDLLNDGWLHAIHPEDAVTAVPKWQAAMKEAKPYENEFRVLLPDGSYRWILVSALPDVNSDGEHVGWFGTCTDIHDRVLAQQALCDSEQLHRSILEASADCIKVIDLEGTIQLMNGPGQRAIGIEDFEAWRGREWASLWPEESRKLVRDALEQARVGKVARFSGFCPRLQGEPRWWDVVVSPMCDDSGAVRRILAISRDVTKEKETSEQLKWASEHDALTSLPNRRAFQARLQAATIRAMESGRSVGLLLIDLDHFKHINDSLGHAAGDHLLQAFGKRLEESVRSNDFVARLGGDEFAVVVERDMDGKTLLDTGESILNRLKQPLTFNGRVMSASARIGGALFPADAQSAHELFNNADTALYALKQTGRGGTKMFHQHMREQAERVASQLSQARIAVSERSVEPHYQPKADLGTGQVKGFEALLRWRHPGLGIQLPETVAEAFKDYELAAKIGELMQRRVFADMKSWLRQKLDFGHVSINAAPAEFLRDDFAERLLGLMREYDIPPKLVEVEVTEHVFFDRTSDYVSRALGLLHTAGVRIALDDFGTGYSSLSHLRDFPVDAVKIDQSFVGSMEKNSEINAIVSAVIDLAASLEIQVVAEGVETETQKTLLVQKRCGLGQGYLFGSPICSDEVPRLLKSLVRA